METCPRCGYDPAIVAQALAILQAAKATGCDSWCRILATRLGYRPQTVYGWLRRGRMSEQAARKILEAAR
jgi:hypothetical protein